MIFILKVTHYMAKDLKSILVAKFKATDIKPGFDGWDGMIGIVYKGKA